MIIDAHAHITGPSQLYDYFRQLSASTGPSRPRPPDLPDDLIEASIQDHLAEVRGAGTDLQLVCPRPWAFPTMERREAIVIEMARLTNDMIARCVKLHGQAFRGVAGLPQAPGLSLRRAAEELERCVLDLGFVGCKINPDPGEGAVECPGLGDEYWYPLYEKMVALDVPGLVHGGNFRFSREPELGYFITEQTIAAFALLRSRVFHDFPGLKLIIGHGGGYLPYQAGRARAFRLNEMRRDPGLEPFDASMRRLFYDTVLYNQESLELLIRVVGYDRCLFGSDKPANGSVIDPMTGRAFNDIRPLLESIDWLDDAQRRAIYETNALRVFSRLAPTLAR